MKPGFTLLLALAAPTLAGCAGLGLGAQTAPTKPAVAVHAPAPQPMAPVGAVQAQPLPPGASVSAASTPPAPAASMAAPQPAPTPAPAIPSGAALGGVLGGPVGLSLTEADRQAAWNAQIAALDSGQRRSWRGANGVFGYVAPGPDAGGGCRAYTQTIYIAGRPNRGQGVACRQADGTWKMTS